MRVRRVSTPVRQARSIAPADPAPVPGLDELRAQTRTLTPTDVRVTHGYLLHVSEGHGCHGIGNALTVFDTSPWTLDAWDQVVGDADRAADAALARRRAQARSAAGAKPVWDAAWPGTRGEYDEALRAWEQAVRVNAWSWDEFSGLVTAGRQVLTTTEPVDAVNGETDRRPGQLRALVAHLERGCRCMCSSRWVDDADDIREYLGLSAADPWPSPVGDGTDSWLSPPVTVLTFPGGQQLLCAGHVDSAAVLDMVRGVVTRFEKQLDNMVAQRREDLAAFARLYDDARLDGCAYAEYEQHKNDPQQRRSEQYRLSYPIDACAMLEKTFATAAMVGVGHDSFATWVAAFTP